MIESKRRTTNSNCNGGLRVYEPVFILKDRVFLFSIALVISRFTYGQETIEIYLNSKFELTRKERAECKCEAEFDMDNFRLDGGANLTPSRPASSAPFSHRLLFPTSLCRSVAFPPWQGACHSYPSDRYSVPSVNSSR